MQKSIRKIKRKQTGWKYLLGQDNARSHIRICACINKCGCLNPEVIETLQTNCIVSFKPLQKSTFFTSNRHGYSVQFSPFDANCLAVATSSQFGSVGAGTLFLLRLHENGTIHETSAFEWADALFDIAWSKQASNVLITACGDGGIQLWDTDSNILQSSYLNGYSKPKQCYCEHSQEVCSVDWSHLSPTPLFLSSSWDCSIKLWNPDYAMSLTTYNSHSKLVYATKFAKKMANMFASVSGDGYLKIWNVLHPQPITTILAHPESEVLSCDWSEHDPNMIATGGSDGQIRGWDLRYTTAPLFELYGCEYSVRKVRFSPFDSHIVAAVSYDHTARIWNWSNDCEPIETLTHHSECNFGLDWNRFVRNQLADCGWDSVVNVYTTESLN